MAIKQTVDLLERLDPEKNAHLMHEAAFQYAYNRLKQNNYQMDVQNCFPAEEWSSMGDQGFHGVTIDPKYGGCGAGYLAHMGIFEAFSYYSPSAALSYGAHSNLCMNQIQLNGKEEQKQKFLPKLCSGEFHGALAMSEPEAGSDIMSMTLKATPCDNGFLLNGMKTWITNGGTADVMIVYGKVDPKDKKTMTAFIVERNNSETIKANKINKMGMRGSETYELAFQDHFVPAENILGAVNNGAQVLMSGLNYERLVLAAGPLGIAQRSLDETINYTNQRKQFGKALIQNQTIAHQLAEMDIKLHAARSYVYLTGAETTIPDRKLSNEAAAGALFMASDVGKQIAVECIRLCGGMGYTKEMCLEQNMRDVLLYEIGAGARDIRLEIVGRSLIQP